MVWLYILQLIIYCAIFTGMVCFDVKGGAINGLFLPETGSGAGV